MHRRFSLNLNLLGLFHLAHVHGNFRKPLGHVRRHIGLVAAAQVLGQELFHRREHGHLVDRPGKAVALVVGQQVLHREALIPQGHHNLVRLALLHPGIVGSLHHHERGFHLVHVVERRLAFQLSLAFRGGGVAHADVENDPHGLPVRRDGLQKRDEVGRTHDVHRRRVKVGREGDARQCGVAAVGTAHDAHPFGIGNALFHQVFHTPGDVVLHFFAPLLVAGVQKRLAVAGGAAEVGLQHGVAAVGQKLRHAGVSPEIPRPGSPMGHHHQRQVFGGDALGQGEVGGDFQPVGRAVADGLHRGQVLPGEALADAVLERELFPFPVKKVGFAGLGVSGGGDQHELFVPGHGGDVDHLARKLLLEVRVHLSPGGIAEVNPGFVFQVHGAHQLIGALGKDRLAQIHPSQGVAFNLFLLPGGQIQKRKLDEVDVFTAVGEHVHLIPVLAKTQGAAGFQHRAAVNLLELPGVKRQDFGVPVFQDARRQARLALQVKLPSHDAVGVLVNKLLFAGGNAHAVEVVPGGIPVVKPNPNDIRLLFGDAVNHRAHPFEVGEVAGFGCGFALLRWVLGVYRPDVVVFVPVVVLHEQDEAGILAPEETGDGPFGFGS
ncbi:hypothetical protein HRbin09_02023 [bacterium HR09]|nr:hypothetical protein HRbin09_02023 [bacterium HR09]